MKSLLSELSARVRAAMEKVGVDGDPLVIPANDSKFGDYQSNCAMGLGKRLGRKPRDIATELVAALEVADICEPPTIAGPGFINFRFLPGYLSDCLSQVPAVGEPLGDRLGIAKVDTPEVVAIDLSSPNLAKEMHVGHLRSTIIGDAVARFLEFQGHEVIRENHVGDWGTQFGMLVAYLRRTEPQVLDDLDALRIGDLEAFYVAAKGLFDSDDEFKAESQRTVVTLQAGDPETRAIWQAFCAESLRHCHDIYRRLDVELIDRGESFYNDLMPVVVERLVEAGIAVESDGALVVYLDGFKARDGEPLPLIIRKKDGGYNYASSDLATILHRIETLHVKRLIYVVGAPQKLHFQMVFATAAKAGWTDDSVRLEHLPFGSMLGKDGSPFKTREGGTVKLKGLLDEAVERAREVVIAAPGADGEEDERRQTFSPEEVAEIAETVGLAAVKYYDLSRNLSRDYKFDLDSMLSFDGNTAPYMLYAYARVRSIGRKAGVDLDALAGGGIDVEEAVEIDLARSLLRLPDVIAQLGRDPKPNLLTEYLYDLSKDFSRFYDRKVGVRVVNAENDQKRASRLRLCALTARTLKLGLSMLGIRTLERM